jgi:hypothetical protein
MNIKLTLKSTLLVLLGLGMYFTGVSQSNTGTVKGELRLGGKPTSNISVKLINDRGDSVSSKKTDVNGNFDFNLVEPGEYEVKVDATKEYGEFSENVVVQAGQQQYVKIGLAAPVPVNVLEGVRVIDKNKKETKLTKPGVVTSKTAAETNKMGLRSLTGAANYASGLTSTANGISGRASRTDGTAYYVDGVRVQNTSLTQSIGSQVDILQAGIPAQYGDFTGVGISITTKGGVSPRKNGSIEVRSSSMFNPYHFNLIEGFYATPILWRVNPDYKTGKSSIKRIAVAAMNVAGNFNYQREPQPSYIGYQVIKDDKLAALEQNPLLINTDGGFVNAASYLTAKDYNTVKVRPNVYNLSSSAQAKFDFRLSEHSTLTAFGNFSYNNSVGVNTNNIMAYKNNPMNTSTYALGYIKYTQTFKGPDSLKKANSTTLNNTYFTVRFDYQSTWAKAQDADHRDNVFDYGYIGQFKHYPTEFYSYYGNINNPGGQSRRFVDQNGDTVYLRNFWEQTGFRDTSIKFVQADINTVRGNYTKSLFDKYSELGGRVTSDAQILQGLGLLNGYNPNNIYSLWNVPGTQLAGYSKSQSERYTLFAMGETEVKGPLSIKSKAGLSHKLQFGLTYEQSVSRSYGLAANNLWRLMYQYANSHISELDKENPIITYDANGVFQDTVRYNRLVNTSKQSQFDREFRNKLISQGATDIYGKKITESTFLDINSYKPSDFTLNMFSADELLNNGSIAVSYNGYDYLGNKLRGKPSVNDFLLDKNKRSIGAFMPIYTAAWFQDQFSFKDLEFRLGLRVERYDANQLVLKDPYSLYPIKQAGEVTELDGNQIKHPDNIGNDYAVYVDDVKNPRKILGYRKDNTWYDENGTQLSSPDLIANRTSNGKIAPYLVDPNKQEVTANSFKDYKPKVNILPRVFFKFPLNKTSLFFASYDVLAQRPSANFATIDDYVFLTQKASDAIQNPALTSRITTDYQIGFKQQVAPSTLLSLISYYRETRNDISAFQFNNAYPITYISYNNLDFSTAKGLILEIDYKADNNISLTGNYTLQFADGTGSNINSQRALIASNQPNLRSLFPLGDLDIRHQFKAIFNWEFFDGKGLTAKEKTKRKYLGPIIGKTQILSNTNFNLAFTAVSGLPYTATSQPVQLGSVDRAPIKGTPFGSRLPWQLNTNLNIQKDIALDWKNKDGKSKNAYLQVYYYVTNLFNTRIVYAVNPYTGATDDDGFLNSPKGQQALNTQLSAEAYSYYYKTAVNSPFNYQTPRMMFLGAKMFF